MWLLMVVTQLSLSSGEVAASKYFFPFSLRIWNMCLSLSSEGTDITVELPSVIVPVGVLHDPYRQIQSNLSIYRNTMGHQIVVYREMFLTVQKYLVQTFLTKSHL